MFKPFYRREVVKHTLTCLEENISREINVLLAMNFARRAWHTVNDVTVKNCFQKSGLCISPANHDLLLEEYEDGVEVQPHYAK